MTPISNKSKRMVLVSISQPEQLQSVQRQKYKRLRVSRSKYALFPRSEPEDDGPSTDCSYYIPEDWDKKCFYMKCLNENTGLFWQFNDTEYTYNEVLALYEHDLVQFPFIMAYDHRLATQLNGPNGEYTSKDDVKPGSVKIKVKGPRQKKKETIVVKVTPKKTNQQKRKSTTNRNGLVMSRVDNPEKKLVCSMINPLSEEAEGVKIPDEYVIGSTTLRCKGMQVINTSTNMTELDYCWIGHPYQTCWSSLVNCTISPNCYSQYDTVTAHNGEWMYATTPELLKVEMSSYRVASNGFILKSRLKPLECTGSITIVRVPMGKNIFGPDCLRTIVDITNTQSLNKICGISPDTDGRIPINIIELCEQETYEMSELDGRELYISNRPVSARWLDFNLANGGNNSTQVGGQYLSEGNTSDSVGNVVTTDTEDCTSTDGWTCILIRGEGLPSGVPVLEIKSAIHLEGMPQIAATSSIATFIPETRKVRPAVGALNRVLDKISNMPVSVLVDVVAKTAVGGPGKGINAAIRALGL